MDEIERLTLMRDHFRMTDPNLSMEISQKLKQSYGIGDTPAPEEAPRTERAVNPKVPAKRSRRST